MCRKDMLHGELTAPTFSTIIKVQCINKGVKCKEELTKVFIQTCFYNSRPCDGIFMSNLCRNVIIVAYGIVKICIVDYVFIIVTKLKIFHQIPIINFDKQFCLC